eukprot:3107414-Rhodomonas_salina.3
MVTGAGFVGDGGMSEKSFDPDSAGFLGSEGGGEDQAEKLSCFGTLRFHELTVCLARSQAKAVRMTPRSHLTPARKASIQTTCKTRMLPAVLPSIPIVKR